MAAGVPSGHADATDCVIEPRHDSLRVAADGFDVVAIGVEHEGPFARIEKRISNQDHRPLARDPQKFRELFDKRRSFYSQADYTIPFNTDNAQDAVQAILALGLLD